MLPRGLAGKVGRLLGVAGICSRAVSRSRYDSADGEMGVRCRLVLRALPLASRSSSLTPLAMEGGPLPPPDRPAERARCRVLTPPTEPERRRGAGGVGRINDGKRKCAGGAMVVVNEPSVVERRTSLWGDRMDNVESTTRVVTAWRRHSSSVPERRRAWRYDATTKERRGRN